MSSLIRGAATVQPEDALGPSPMVEFNFVRHGLLALFQVCSFFLFVGCVCGRSRAQPEVGCGMRSVSHSVDAHDEALFERGLQQTTRTPAHPGLAASCEEE